MPHPQGPVFNRDEDREPVISLPSLVTPIPIPATTPPQREAAGSSKTSKRRMATIIEESSLQHQQSTSPLQSSSLSRRNSLLSEFTNIEEAFIPTVSVDGSTWHSLPLAFAVLPAVGGMLWTDGNLLVTDIMLLVLATVFLHWLVKFPWEWYHSSHEIKADLEYGAPETTETNGIIAKKDSIIEAARVEMHRNETLALLFCFLGPVIGGWLLHTIRSQLSRPSEGLVSNFNLTVFVLAAELRPTAQVIELMRSRSLYLQNMIHHPPKSRVDQLATKVDELSIELKALTAMTTKALKRGTDLDADLDALNRVVRRYEKKEAVSSAQTKTKIMEIDNRLHDVLAMVATTPAKQQPAFSRVLIEWICAGIVIPFLIACKLMTLSTKSLEILVGVITRWILLLRGKDTQSQTASAMWRGVRRNNPATGSRAKIRDRG